MACAASPFNPGVGVSRQAGGRAAVQHRRTARAYRRSPQLGPAHAANPLPAASPLPAGRAGAHHGEQLPGGALRGRGAAHAAGGRSGCCLACGQSEQALPAGLGRHVGMQDRWATSARLQLAQRCVFTCAAAVPAATADRPQAIQYVAEHGEVCPAGAPPGRCCLPACLLAGSVRACVLRDTPCPAFPLLARCRSSVPEHALRRAPRPPPAVTQAGSRATAPWWRTPRRAWSTLRAWAGRR